MRKCTQCRKPVKPPRRKYCSRACLIKTLYIDARALPRVSITCQNDKCSKVFSSTSKRKFCSYTCYYQGRSGRYMLAAEATGKVHECDCCDPPKLIPITDKYCLENKWMLRVTHEERTRFHDNTSKMP